MDVMRVDMSVKGIAGARFGGSEVVDRVDAPTRRSRLDEVPVHVHSIGVGGLAVAPPGLKRRLEP